VKRSGAGYISAFVLALALSGAAMAAEQPGQRAGATDWLRNLAENGTSGGRVILLDQALQGYAEAQFTLATMYRGGVGAARDMAQARRWYQAAAAQGHKAALESLRALAGEGDSAAFYALGVLSRDGLGVERDPLAARRAFHWAGEGGHILAHFALAEMMATGLGGTVDEPAALRNYRQAVHLARSALALPASAANSSQLSQSRATAQYWIGKAYLAGQGGVAQNAAAAAWWFESAADWGLADAQYELGRLHARGFGVSRDVIRAIAWLEKAAAQGTSAADDELARIKNENE